MEYTVVLDYDSEEDVYNVSVPALPGCLTWGKTRAQAIKRAKQAIEVFVDVLHEFGDTLAESTPRRRGVSF